MTATDIRSLPDAFLNAYLFPVGAWGVAYAGLFLCGYDAWAIPLLYPLALWQISLTTYWVLRTIRAVRAEQLTPPEVGAGVRSIGGIAAADALLPGVVFLVNDPLSSNAHGTALGVAAVAGVAYLLVRVSPRFSNNYLYAAVLAFACLALPINATGAVTVAKMAGWFDKVAQPSKELIERAVPLHP
jgi:hypothetical protein